MHNLSDEPNASPVLLSQLSDRTVAFLLFLLVFAVYGMTMCRTIYTGDDGDFITAIATGGVPHPTGYPLFCLIGRFTLWALSPVLREPAARINLMTAFFGAASIGFFYRFFALLLPRFRMVAAASALTLAFAPTLWQQSLSCEVYSLTCLSLGALLYLTTLWQQDPTNTCRLRGLAFVFGLALTNHLTIALFFPGFFLLVFLTRRPLWREIGVLLSLVGLFLLPLTLYAYLPIAAGSLRSPIFWCDPVTPANFFAEVSGEMYRGGGGLGQPLDVAWHHLANYGGSLWAEFTGWLLWLVPVGSVALWRKNRALCLLLSYIWVADVTFAINYNIFDIYVYYIPSYAVVAAFLGVGAAWLLEAAVTRARLTEVQRSHYAPLFAAITFAACGVHVSDHWAASDKSGNFLESDFAANIMASAPRHSLILTGTSTTFTLWYDRFVRVSRADVTPIDWNMARGVFFYSAWYFRHIEATYPDIRTDAIEQKTTQDDAVSGKFLAYILRRALERGTPVFVVPDDANDTVQTDPRAPSFRQWIADAGLERVPWGIGERLYLKGQVPPAATITAANAVLWPRFQTRGLYTGWAFNDPMQEQIPLRYARAGLDGGAWAERAGNWELADTLYEQTQRLYKSKTAEAGRARCAPHLKR